MFLEALYVPDSDLFRRDDRVIVVPKSWPGSETTGRGRIVTQRWSTTGGDRAREDSNIRTTAAVGSDVLRRPICAYSSALPD